MNAQTPFAGIVRPARRPSGWRAPGPPPFVPHDRPEVWPGVGEDLCCLAGDWRILQRVRGHRWSLDDLVTAWFAAAQFVEQPPKRIADLGCGIGAVLLLLAWRFPAARCMGIEAQELSISLARRSLGWNGVENRCAVRLGDLRDPALAPEGAVYDLVTGTPPYLPPGTATEPTRLQKAACHIEQRGGVEAYCAAAARLMRRGACFVVAHPRPARVVRAAAAAGLAVAQQRAIIPRHGKAPLFSVFVLRHADASVCGRVLPPLVVRDVEGDHTAEFGALRRQMGMPP